MENDMVFMGKLLGYGMLLGLVALIISAGPIVIIGALVGGLIAVCCK